MTTGKKTKDALKEKFFITKSHAKLTSGEILRIIREKNGLTQEQLAKKSGLKQSTISSFESDRIAIGADRARALAKALQVHPAVFVFPDWDQNYAKVAG